MISSMPPSTRRPKLSANSAVGVADSLIDLLLLPLREADTMLDRVGPERPMCARSSSSASICRSGSVHRPDLRRARLLQALSAHAVFRARHPVSTMPGRRACKTAARNSRPTPRSITDVVFSGASPAHRISAGCSGNISAWCRPRSTRRSRARPARTGIKKRCPSCGNSVLD